MSARPTQASRRRPEGSAAVLAGGTELDTVRLCRERHQKVQDEMSRRDLDALLLIGSSPVTYASGSWSPPVDPGLALVLRPIALVVAEDEFPHLFTPYPEGAPDWLPPDHVHGPCGLEDAGGVSDLAARLREVHPGPMARLGIDEMTGAMFTSLEAALSRSFGAGTSVVGEAQALLSAARLCKTDDELECIRRAQRINELAIEDVEQILRAGVRQSELTGRFLRRVLEFGADGWALDPIWQVVPDHLEAFPATTHGGIAFPLTSTDRAFSAGDVVWVDTGVVYSGYVSDFGRTWEVTADHGRSATRSDAYRRWRDIVGAVLDQVRPGATGGDLVRAACEANGGDPPWPAHFYLAHGIGLDSAEAPLVGTDLGPTADEALTLAPGMVLVIEPETWLEGEGGYRAEEVLTVTEDGFRLLTQHHWWPYA